MQFTFPTGRIEVTTPTRAELERRLKQHFVQGEGFALATLNLDHLVKLRASPSYLRAYAAHTLVVADGWSIVTLSKLAKQRLELMPGSDLVVPMCQWAAETGVKVGLLGSTETTLRSARDSLQEKVPNLNVAFLRAPPMGFDPASSDAADLLRELERDRISLCLVALGAPKQEQLAARGRELSPSVGFASIGAGLDFLSGRQRRAPAVIRRLKLEWLWRALSDPIRLAPRYARCLAILPSEVIKAVRRRKLN